MITPRGSAVLMVVTAASCARAGGPGARPLPVSSASTPARQQAIEVAVTVDDLPVHGPLPPGQSRIALARRFVEVFRNHHLPPVYGFVNGRPAAEDPGSVEVLTAWTQAGNHLANHTYAHVSLNAVTLTEYFEDLARGEAILDAVEPPWRSLKVFRYPFLFEGNTAEKREGVRTYLRAHGYLAAPVSVEADDWAFNAPFARCAQQGDRAALARLHRRFVDLHLAELQSMTTLTRRLEGRDVRHILLLHIGAADADALDELLTTYERAGVRWISLPDALADPFYAFDPGVPFPFGAALPYVVARVRGVPAPPAIYDRGLERELAAMCTSPGAPGHEPPTAGRRREPRSNGSRSVSAPRREGTERRCLRSARLDERSSLRHALVTPS